MDDILQFNQYSFFTEMSELAVRHNSYDLSLGLPDFEVDVRLKEFLRESADINNHNYESLAGNSLLTEQIIRFNSNRRHPIYLKTKEISIIPCSTFGVYTSLRTVINPGNEVIVIQPSYYTYAPAIIMNGGIPVYCDVEENFSVNWERLKSKISDKTKAIIVNSPQNPTGKIWTAEDWNCLYELIKDREIYLISEEVYDIYYYDGLDHYSSFLHPELKERTFCIFSFGKMFHTTGWKVSYLLATEKLTMHFRNHQQYISYGVNSPSQYAMARYLEVFDPSVNQVLMEHKRDMFYNLIKDTPLEIEKKAPSCFFQVVNFRNISKSMTDIEFSKWLTVEKKVSCLPLSAFYQTKNNSDYIRFSFVKKDEIIRNSLEHLRRTL
ncbi:aminotransferase class I/II-fold pyridoxal phosphate-dependent enzyme [Chryseobacterium sp. CT-SW4]|uniref:aminotransferase class I/II-fold pyridoxal phosphate-dependent enzyme n=1 Tax=Chryseobacterium sp. SW-1 TaxID=3157343 RepID=UPI003B029640